MLPSARSLVSDSTGNPYQGIPSRNIFALKPPPPTELTPPSEIKPPVKLTLSGLTDILGKKQALLKAQIPPRPPAEPAKEESYILAEGQSESDVQVLAIDQKAGTVKVNNHGTIQTLDFVNNGAKLPTASPLPSIGGLPPVPGNPIPPGAMTGSRPFPSFPVPAGSAPGINSGQPSGDPSSSAQYGNSAGPGFGGNTGAVQPVQVPSQAIGLRSDEQAVLIELERERLQRTGDENYKLMPPTEFSEAAQ